MTNEDVAAAFREIATLLELKGDSPFQVRAYRRAADQIQEAEDLAALAREGRLTDLPGVGKAIADKIGYLLATGTVPLLTDLRREIPPGLVELSRIPGLGPGRIRTARESIGIESVDDLADALGDGRLGKVKGFGPKLMKDLARALGHWKENRGRRLHRAAREEAETVLSIVLASGAGTAGPGGELARWHETVSDIILIASADHPEKLLEEISRLFDDVSNDADLIRFTSPGGLPVTLRVVEPARFGAALLHGTGNDAHWAELTALAGSRSLRLDRNGLFDGDDLLSAPDESSVCSKLGIDPIPAEAREGSGEIDLARSGKFPVLIEEGDLRGVVHVHSTWSDGKASVREMAERTRELGFDYLGIADHSRSAGYAGGLSVERLIAQGAEIARLNEELQPFHVFRGVESDILADGSLDYDEEILEKLDFVIASIHSRFGLGRREQTARLVAAVENRRTTCLGHSSGRLLLTRKPYDFDPDAVWEAAARSGTAVELNAHEQRLDVDWRELGKLRELGVPIWISADAHSLKELEHHALAIRMARKGLLEKRHVLNTLPADRFAESLIKK